MHLESVALIQESENQMVITGDSVLIENVRVDRTLN